MADPDPLEFMSPKLRAAAEKLTPEQRVAVEAYVERMQSEIRDTASELLERAGVSERDHFATAIGVGIEAGISATFVVLSNRGALNLGPGT